jgi:addiction module HigA family antidote
MHSYPLALSAAHFDPLQPPRIRFRTWHLTCVTFGVTMWVKPPSTRTAIALGAFPMSTRNRPPAHPGRILKNLYLSPLGVSNTELAKALCVSRKAISNIVNEHKSVTPEMALRLSRAFPNTLPEFWLNLQKNYDLWHAARDSLEWQQVQPLFQPSPDAPVLPAGHSMYPEPSDGWLRGLAPNPLNALRESDETETQVD